MPQASYTAILTPGKPGRGTIKLIRCGSARSALGNYENGISMLVVRRNERRLADWYSPSPDGFLTVKPISAQDRGMDFEFTVGPEVINAIAYDNTGDYILKIRRPRGDILSVIMTLQGSSLSPDTQYVAQNDASFSKAAAGAEGASGAAAAQGAGAGAGAGTGIGVGAGAGAGVGAGVGAGASSSGSGAALRYGLIGLGALALIAAVFFFLKMILGLFGGSVATSVVTPETPEQTQEQISENAAAPDESAEPNPDAGADATAPDESAAADAAKTPVEPEIPAASAQNADASGQEITLHGTTALSAKGGACSLDGRTESDVEVLKDCISSRPSDADMLALLKQAVQADRCEIVLRLLRARGRSPDGSVYAYIYAVFADPASSVSSSCIVKSEDDAAYWLDHVKRDKNFDKETADLAVSYVSGR